MLLIHAGAPDPQKAAAFRDALLKVGLPPETRLVWRAGEPAEAIAAAAESEGVDLVIAGALDRQAAANAPYVGAVARPLAERARGSVLLLSQPQLAPKPFRRVVGPVTATLFRRGVTKLRTYCRGVTPQQQVRPLQRGLRAEVQGRELQLQPHLPDPLVVDQRAVAGVEPVHVMGPIERA